MRHEIRIGGRRIGEGQPLFIIAEAGVTCNYDLDITKRLVDAVRDAGADAIKLIFWFPEEIMSDKTISYSYETVDGAQTENMFEMLNSLRFTFDQWFEVKRYADDRGVVLFSTVNSPSGIEWAERLGLEAYKVSSWDYNYTGLWNRIAGLGKPMIIDTGPVTTLEVAKALDIMRRAGNDQAILVHCPHAEEWGAMNMRSIPYMRSAFDALVGWSSRGQESEADIVAVTLGAVVIEKRLTLRRTLPGHHHILSLEPAEFAAWVRMIRNVQAGLGRFDLVPSAADFAERRRWFRHLVANVPLAQGTRLTEAMLEAKRPEAGVSPEYMDLFIGRVLKRNLAYNEGIQWDDIL